ncbi:glucosamine-6-phosphate deaminase [Flavobacterium ovatum]|uniref:glucosamine-6-phosphate deaminase n=1 Tax=Flavobacterium ovatum TaxID=1928857 RepID=UPI00344EB840
MEIFNRENWEQSSFTTKEKIHTQIFNSSEKASKEIANEIADTIKSLASQGKMCVLGLATGSSPITIYQELIRLHEQESLSFKNVISFNLDEYFPMQPYEVQSYVRFMKEHLFDAIDIKPENIHVPDGTIPKDQVQEYCINYERQIEQAGGIDIQLLGIGRTGHIGFNEPGSLQTSKTRMITLDHITRLDAASDFFKEENVPTKAITMGIGTILKAKKIILMAWGEGKAPIIKRAVEGVINDQVPATYLQAHSNTVLVMDSAASAELTQIAIPWTLGNINWNEQLAKRAVIWLSQKTQKPILKLTDRDYSDYGMNDLILEKGNAHSTNIKVFNHLQHTITGWPGGKPNVDDSNRPERAIPAKKRVLLFSPHPDDDVISMGGTFIRLVDQGHEVHVAYQTSGNIAVFDDDVIRFADFVEDIERHLGHTKNENDFSIYQMVKKSIKEKNVGDVDSDEIKLIKGLIRKSEAKAAARYVGIADEQMHFLNLPFYETGTVKKKPVSQEDIDITIRLIQKIKPHQIYVAGDLSDPHGTHRVCLSIIFQALEQLNNEDFIKDCWVWLYRGAWQEWPIDEIDMAVPLSPEELLRKRKAIFKHQSQKDSALFPGNDEREFWVRAEDRNKSTAHKYDQLGLAEYEAIEAFKRYYY